MPQPTADLSQAKLWKWEIGLTFNQNINPEEKRCVAYIVLKIITVKKKIHPHILTRGFEILNYGEVALLHQCLFLNPSYFNFQTSPVNKMKKHSFVSSSFVSVALGRMEEEDVLVC